MAPLSYQIQILIETLAHIEGHELRNSKPSCPAAITYISMRYIPTNSIAVGSEIMAQIKVLYSGQARKNRDG